MGYLNHAERKGLAVADPSSIEVVGERVENVKRRFRLRDRARIRLMWDKITLPK